MWIAEAQVVPFERGVGPWVEIIEATSSEDAMHQAYDFVRGIFRPAGLTLCIRVFGPFEYDWNDYVHEGYV